MKERKEVIIQVPRGNKGEGGANWAPRIPVRMSSSSGSDHERWGGGGAELLDPLHYPAPPSDSAPNPIYHLFSPRGKKFLTLWKN